MVPGRYCRDAGAQRVIGDEILFAACDTPQPIDRVGGAFFNLPMQALSPIHVGVGRLLESPHINLLSARRRRDKRAAAARGIRTISSPGPSRTDSPAGRPSGSFHRKPSDG